MSRKQFANADVRQFACEALRLLAGRSRQRPAEERVRFVDVRQRRRKIRYVVFHAFVFGQLQNVVGRFRQQSSAPLRANLVGRREVRYRTLYAHHALRYVRRKTPEKRSARRNDRRLEHLRINLAFRGKIARFSGRTAIHRRRKAHRGGHFKRNPQPPRLSEKRRAAISYAFPFGGGAFGRRSAAYPPRHADRQRAHGRFVYSRRAEHRAAPARQRKTAFLPARSARSRQYAHRGGTRRRHHPRGGLYRGHRSVCGRARRRSGSVRHAGRYYGGAAFDHGRLSGGQKKNRNAENARAAGRQMARTEKMRAEQFKKYNRALPRRAFHGGNGRIGQRKIFARQRGAV